jgi:hypothetical protein
MPRYTYVVLTNPVPGRDEEYNDWYTNQHLGDVLDIPGIVAAQRFKLTDKGDVGEKTNFQYLALYEIDTDDLDGVLKDLGSRSGTERMPMSEAFGDTVWTKIYEAITPRVAEA